jgi:hypothetical protein
MTKEEAAQILGLSPGSVMSPEYQANAQRAQSAGFLDNFGRGVVSNLGDRALGLKAFGQRVMQDPEGAAQTTDRIKERQAANAPLGMTWGGGLGKVGSDLLPTFLPGVNSIPGAMALGATMGASEPADNALGAFGNIATGAAIGGAGQKVGDFLARGVGGGVANPEALAAARRVGYRPTPAQRSQNPATMGFENYLSKMPGSAGVIQARSEANQTALNDAMARAMGVSKTTALKQGSSGRLNEDVFKAASKGLENESNRLYGMVATDFNVPNTPLERVVNSLEQRQVALAKHGRSSPEVLGEIDKLRLTMKQGAMDGESYRLIREELSNAADSAFSSGKNSLGIAIKDMKTALDDTVYSQLPTKDAKAAWKAFRDQSAAGKTATKGAVVENQDVSPTRVNSALRQFNDKMQKRGTHPQALMDIARIGDAYRSVGNPNSGQLPAWQKTMENLPGSLLATLPLNYGLAKGYLFEPNMATRLLAPMLQANRPMALGGLFGPFTSEEQQ